MASSSLSGERTSHPGPVDSSLLHMQEFHVSQNIWNGEPDRILIVRRAQGLHQRGVQRTRRWITREGAKIGSLVDSLERMYYYTTEEGRDAFSLDALRGDAAHCLQILGEMKHILEPSVSSPPLNHEIPEPEINITIPVGQVEGHELVHHKRRGVQETSTIPQIQQPASSMYCVPPVTPLAPMPTCFYPSHPTSVGASSSSTAHPSPIQSSNNYYIPGIPAYYAPSAYPPYFMTHLARSPWPQTHQNAPPMPSTSEGM
ncbi:hypothetical protein VNO77_03987 [Canavalia gladiata]|uniref:Uncharacterized protein n=1 Tax=Canavalia gladiata TaxID=3824 RepID=A0AAN9R7C3_CANGL